MESPLLEILSTQLGKALSISLSLAMLGAGDWIRWPLEVPSFSCDPVILNAC